MLLCLDPAPAVVGFVAVGSLVVAVADEDVFVDDAVVVDVTGFCCCWWKDLAQLSAVFLEEIL